MRAILPSRVPCVPSRSSDVPSSLPSFPAPLWRTLLVSHPSAPVAQWGWRWDHRRATKPCCSIKRWANVFTLHWVSSLSCMKEPLVAKSRTSSHFNCRWLDASKRSWNSVWLNRFVRCKTLNNPDVWILHCIRTYFTYFFCIMISSTMLIFVYKGRLYKHVYISCCALPVKTMMEAYYCVHWKIDFSLDVPWRWLFLR